MPAHNLMRLRPLCTSLALLWLCCTGLSAQPVPGAAAALDSMLLEGRHPYLPELDLNRFRAELTELYETAAHALLWSDGRSPTPQAILLISELRAAENQGLRSADYAATRLAYLAIDLASSASAAQAERAQFDIGLTTALFAYLNDLHFGRIEPRTAGLDLQVERSRLDLKALVLGLSRSGDPRPLLQQVEPAFHHYDLLKQALLRYRELALQRELTQLPTFTTRSIRPGEPYAGAPQLRRLLMALGDMAPAANLPAPAADTSLSPDLVAALKRFQARHGLDADSALGKASFRALTTPLTERVRQIELTLERWRWLPPRLDSPPIIVNIPQFKLFAFQTTEDIEERLLSMAVIVGKAFPANQTPVFAADLKYIVLRPYWDVPYSITTRELMPSIRSNPSYLAANRLEIVSRATDGAQPLPATAENIEALANGALRLRQLPGVENSLGLAKFIMPNNYNVYLHGTPAQGLFQRSSRAFSHGCVRVADPVTLAEHVLRGDSNWNRQRILAAMNADRPTQINLKRPIRVFIVYGTAVATESGQVLFLADLYGHDARLSALLRRER